MPCGFTENVRVKGGAQRLSLTRKSMIDRPLPEGQVSMKFPALADDPPGSRFSSGFLVQASEA